MAVRLPPINAALTAIIAVEVENIGGEQVETLVYKWTGSASMFASEKVAFEEAGGAIQADHRDQAIVPSDLVLTEAPDFDIGYLLRYERLGRCELRKVSEMEERADYGFLRCFTDEQVSIPSGTTDPCAP